MISRYKGQDFVVLFLFLLEGLIPVFKSNFLEGCLNNVLWVSSCEVCDALFK